VAFDYGCALTYELMDVPFLLAVYHLGYLLDYTFHTGKFEQCSTIQLRVAIDRVCQNAGTSPVNRVFIGIMKESLSMLGAVKVKTWTQRFKKQPTPITDTSEQSHPDGEKNGVTS